MNNARNPLGIGNKGFRGVIHTGKLPNQQCPSSQQDKAARQMEMTDVWSRYEEGIGFER
jgi:hypothetical protein